MSNCINLRQQFGKVFKVEYEDSYRAERGNGARTPDPWLLIIRCQHGHIFPYGEGRLAASTDRRGPVANRLAGLQCVTLVQDGTDGITAVFDVSDFDRVAEILKPRRRRMLNPEHRAKLIAAGTRNLTQHRQSGDAGSNRRRDPTQKAVPSLGGQLGLPSRPNFQS